MIKAFIKRKSKKLEQLYADDIYMVQLQALYLYLTCLIALATVVGILFVNLAIYWPDGGYNWGSSLYDHLFVDFTLMGLFVLGLILVDKGYYRISANVLGMGSVIFISLGAFLNIDGFLYTGINSFLYLFYAAALFVSFFTENKMRWFLAFALGATNAVLYLIVIFLSHTVLIKEVYHAFLNSTATLILLLSVGQFFMKMLHGTMDKTDKANAIIAKLSEELDSKVILRTEELMEYNTQLEGEIKKRNAIERALKESESRYRTIFENSGTAICIINPSGLISLCNVEFCNITGYTKSELEEKVSWTKFVHHDDFKRIYHFITTIQLQSEYETHTDFRMINRQGRLFELSMNIEKLDESHHLIVSLLDVTEKNNALKTLQKLAAVDSLTELYNRRYLEDHFPSYLEENEDAVAGFLYLDIDNFKKINDTYGHGVGDDLLHDVAIRLKKFVEPSGLAARIGGDEFVMVVFVKDTATLVKRIERFMLEMESPFIYDELTLTLSFSIGVSLSPEQGRSYSELLVKADEAMYIAKARGKNRYTLYESVTSHG